MGDDKRLQSTIKDATEDNRKVLRSLGAQLSEYFRFFEFGRHACVSVKHECHCDKEPCEAQQVK